MHGKMHRRPFPKGRKRCNKIGGLIHADLCGPMQIVSPGLASCVFLILFLNLIYHSFTLHMLGMAANLRTRFNRGVEIFRTDGGGEWIGKEFQQWLQNEGVVHHTTAPYTPP